MSIINYNHARSWHWLYRRQVAQGGLEDHPLWQQWITYGREYAKMMKDPLLDALTWHTEYWDNLINHPTHGLAIPTSARIVFVGCGFGFLAEVARAAGYTSLALVDDSNWIHAHKADLTWRYNGSTWVQDEPQSSETIAQIPLSSPQGIKNHCKTIWGGQGTADWVFTEFMLSSLPDPSDPLYDAGQGDADDLASALADADSLLAAGGTVVHLVTAVPHIRPPFNVKTLAEWRSEVTADGFSAHRVAPASVGQDWEIL